MGVGIGRKMIGKSEAYAGSNVQVDPGDDLYILIWTWMKTWYGDDEDVQHNSKSFLTQKAPNFWQQDSINDRGRTEDIL